MPPPPNESGRTHDTTRAGSSRCLLRDPASHRERGVEYDASVDEPLLAGRYRPTEIIGCGSQGEVVRAHDLIAGCEVAIKLAHPGSERRRATRALREGTALRMLRIPGVVPVLDEGEHEGRAFLVTSLVEGTPYPGVATPARWHEIAACTESLLEVLDAIHGAGVAHGDLKPANVLVDREGRPWVLDFGVSREISARAEPIRHDSGSGTPAFVAPERVRGRPLDPRADLYSVGVMLYQALAGHLPHDGVDARSVLYARLTRPARPLLEVARDVPAAVARAVDAMLAIDPSARPPSAAHVRESLASRERAGTDLLPTGGGPLTATQLEVLFVGDERLLHLRSDAAAALWTITAGDRERVAEELARWCRTGVARVSGDGYRIDRQSLDALEPIATEGAPHERALTAAEHALTRGAIGRAAVLVEEAARALRAEPRAPATIANAVFTTWIDVVAAEQSSRSADRLRYELGHQRDRVPLAHAVDALALAVIEMSSDPPRALARMESLGELPSIRLERCRAALRMIAARSGSLDDEQRVLDDVARHAERSGDADLLARLEGWRGRVAYRAGDHARAAVLHLRSVVSLARPIDAVAARLNAAAALLEGRDPAEVLQVVDEARSALTRLRHPLLEARAEWLIRTARYRMCEPLEPDLELVGSAATLGVPHVEAQIAFTEAAIAWRAGDRGQARALARRAEERWRSTRTNVEFAWLARALRIAAGEDTDAGAVVAATAASSRDAAVQTLGLLALADALPRDARGMLERVALTVPTRDREARLDVISVAEALLAVGRFVDRPA